MFQDIVRTVAKARDMSHVMMMPVLDAAPNAMGRMNDPMYMKISCKSVAVGIREGDEEV